MTKSSRPGERATGNMAWHSGTPPQRAPFFQASPARRGSFNAWSADFGRQAEISLSTSANSFGCSFARMLSRRRAKMVLDYMNSRGVPVDLMKAKAYGRDNPVADNSDPNKAWLNRRAEIIIHPKNDLAIQ